MMANERVAVLTWQQRVLVPDIFLSVSFSMRTSELKHSETHT